MLEMKGNRDIFPTSESSYCRSAKVDARAVQDEGMRVELEKKKRHLKNRMPTS